MQKLGVFIRNFGYSLRSSGDEVHPGEIQKLLDRIAGTPEEAMLSRLTLRSMKQAKYSTDCTWAFRTCGFVLLPFYFPDSALSGFADSQNYQRKFKRTAVGGENLAL